MSLISGSARHVRQIARLRYLRQPRWAGYGGSQVGRPLSRSLSEWGQKPVVEGAAAKKGEGAFWDEYKRSFTVPKPSLKLAAQLPRELFGKEVTIAGFIDNKRDAAVGITFAMLCGEGGLQDIQLIARSDVNEEALPQLRAIPLNSAVSVTGTLGVRPKPKPRQSQLQPDENHVFLSDAELVVKSIECLNSFPKRVELINATERHLQIRFDPELKERLEYRSKVAAFLRQSLQEFTEIETPILFKSTPEGAREFIVPTRTRGYAYSLPQSPQQYKQLLIASGVRRYMQFAKCFRDEDHRADRQPEFTQLDLEMAWADGEDVMNRVEELMKALWGRFSAHTPHPTFQRMRYNDAMAKYGSDKPDLRVPGLIHRIDHITDDDLRSKLTSLDRPVIEAWKIRLNGSPKEKQKFIAAFMESADGGELRTNPDGAPGIFIYDESRPLNGLEAFGFGPAHELKLLFEAAASLPNSTDTPISDGDVIVVQARPDKPHTGGSTMLGKCRRDFHTAATNSKLELAQLNPQDRFLWVTDFPMFTPNNSHDGPNDQGTSGFSATHHPFTAPKSAADVDLLLTDPLRAVADHYDLVLNGVELGGGSRRIHNSEMQQFIMRDILKMDQNRMDSFSHLFKALAAGCPPHAGLAIGFDRLVAVMTGQQSVREVIAFPKDKFGKDPVVKSPSRVFNRDISTYHMQITTSEETPEELDPSSIPNIHRT